MGEKMEEPVKGKRVGDVCGPVCECGLETFVLPHTREEATGSRQQLA